MKMKYMRQGRSISWNEEKEIETLLIGHCVKVEGNNLILDNGICLEVKPNEGCGGCGAGWYDIDYLNECDNAITDVKFVCEDLDEYDEQHCYKIFVFADNKMINLLSVSGDDGNGYYGTGYSFWVSIPWLAADCQECKKDWTKCSRCPVTMEWVKGQKERIRNE